MSDEGPVSPRQRSATTGAPTPSLYFEKIIGKYKILRKIGKGRYGLVKLAQNAETDQYVAIKIVNKSRLNIVEKNSIRTEAEVMSHLSHPNVVQLYEVIETPSELCLVMEYCGGGDLFAHVEKKRRLKEKRARRLFTQILAGVGYCHRHYIVHRDIKAENIFLDDNKKKVTIGDWGFSSEFHPGSKIETACGSLDYAAPEVLSGSSSSVGSHVDVWSLGVLLFFMVTGRLPFTGASDYEIYQQIKVANFQCPRYLTEDCRELICAILQPDVSIRPTVDQIMEHPWCTVDRAKEKLPGIPIVVMSRRRGDDAKGKRSISDTKIEASLMKLKAGQQHYLIPPAAAAVAAASSTQSQQQATQATQNATKSTKSTTTSAGSTKEKRGRESGKNRRTRRVSGDKQARVMRRQASNISSDEHSPAPSPFATITEENEEEEDDNSSTVGSTVSSTQSSPANSTLLPLVLASTDSSSSLNCGSEKDRPRRDSSASVGDSDARDSGSEIGDNSGDSSADEGFYRHKINSNAAPIHINTHPRRPMSSGRYSILKLDKKQLEDLHHMKQFEVLQVTEIKATRRLSAGSPAKHAGEGEGSTSTGSGQTSQTGAAPATDAKSGDKKDDQGSQQSEDDTINVVVVSSKAPNSQRLIRQFEEGRFLVRWNSDTNFKVNERKTKVRERNTRNPKMQALTRIASWSQRRFDQATAAVSGNGDQLKTAEHATPAPSTSALPPTEVSPARRQASKGRQPVLTELGLSSTPKRHSGDRHSPRQPISHIDAGSAADDEVEEETDSLLNAAAAVTSPHRSTSPKRSSKPKRRSKDKEKRDSGKKKKNPAPVAATND